MNFNITTLIFFALFLIFLSKNKEYYGGTSPGTLIQLSANSGYYPFWRHGFGYNYPYYQFKYPYYTLYPMMPKSFDYENNNYYDNYNYYDVYNHHYPKPYGFY